MATKIYFLNQPELCYWSNQSFNKPTNRIIDKFNSNNAQYWDTLDNLTVAYDSIDRGKIKLDLSSAPFTKNVDDKIKKYIPNYCWIADIEKYFFMYPQKPRSNNHSLITFELIYDVWLNEITPKIANASLKGNKVLTSDLDEIKETLIKQPRIFIGRNRYISDYIYGDVNRSKKNLGNFNFNICFSLYPNDFNNNGINYWNTFKRNWKTERFSRLIYSDWQYYPITKLGYLQRNFYWKYSSTINLNVLENSHNYRIFTTTKWNKTWINNAWTDNAKTSDIHLTKGQFSNIKYQTLNNASLTTQTRANLTKNWSSSGNSNNWLYIAIKAGNNQNLQGDFKFKIGFFEIYKNWENNLNNKYSEEQTLNINIFSSEISHRSGEDDYILNPGIDNYYSNHQELHKNIYYTAFDLNTLQYEQVLYEIVGPKSGKRYWIIYDNSYDEIALITDDFILENANVTIQTGSHTINTDYKTHKEVVFWDASSVTVPYGDCTINWKTTNDLVNSRTTQFIFTSNVLTDYKYITQPLETSETLANQVNIQNQILQMQNNATVFSQQEKIYKLQRQQAIVNNAFGIVNTLFGGIGKFLGGKFLGANGVASAVGSGINTASNLAQSQINYQYDNEIAERNWAITKVNYETNLKTLQNNLTVNEAILNQPSNWRLIANDNRPLIAYITTTTWNSNDEYNWNFLINVTGYPTNLINKPVTWGINAFVKIDESIFSNKYFIDEIKQMLTIPFNLINDDLINE